MDKVILQQIRHLVKSDNSQKKNNLQVIQIRPIHSIQNDKSTTKMTIRQNCVTQEKLTKMLSNIGFFQPEVVIKLSTCLVCDVTLLEHLPKS